MSRQIKKIYENKEQDEGVGARVRRSIGSSEVRIPISFKYCLYFVYILIFSSETSIHSFFLTSSMFPSQQAFLITLTEASKQ